MHKKFLALLMKCLQLYAREYGKSGGGCLHMVMKRSRNYKAYPDWRQREFRFLLASIVVGAIAAAITALVIYFANRGRGF